MDHPTNGSDDFANALAGALRCMTATVDVSLSWVSGDADENVDGKQEHAVKMLTGYLLSQGYPC